MEHFLGCHLNAFEFFAARIPARIMVDNLKSAVLQRSIGQPPVFNPRYADFARHHRFEIAPCTSSQRCASSCCCSATHREHPDSFAGASTAAAATPPPAMTPCSHPLAIHSVYRNPESGIRNPESVSSDAPGSRCLYKSALHARTERLRTFNRIGHDQTLNCSRIRYAL